MKFSSSIFLTTASIALALFSTNAAAAAAGDQLANGEEGKISNLRSGEAGANTGDNNNERKLQISAYYYGYGEAQNMWNKGKYKCTSDDVQAYESSIRKKPICEEQYKQNSSFIRACNDGINDYIEEREKKCFASVDECEGFGQTIADGIIATHCVLIGATSSGRKWPRSCKNIAIKQCEDIVKNSKNYPCKPPSGSQEKRLAALCEPEVEAYLSGPAPSPTPKGWDRCAAISSTSKCKDCCKDEEDKKNQVCKCQNYAGCPRESCQ